MVVSLGAVALIATGWAKAGAPGQPPAMRKLTGDDLERTAAVRTFQAPAGAKVGTIVFGVAGGGRVGAEPVHYDTWPVVAVQKADGWNLVDLKTRFYQHAWSHAAAVPEKGYYWGFLEFTVEGPGHELPIVTSHDGGRSWQLTVLKKPDYLAQFHDFSMGPDGRGTLTLAMEEPERRDVRQRFYTWQTADWGRTWSRTGGFRSDVLEKGNGPPFPAACLAGLGSLAFPLPAACRLPAGS